MGPWFCCSLSLFTSVALLPSGETIINYALNPLVMSRYSQTKCIMQALVFTRFQPAVFFVLNVEGKIKHLHYQSWHMNRLVLRCFYQSIRILSCHGFHIMRQWYCEGARIVNQLISFITSCVSSWPDLAKGRPPLAKSPVVCNIT